MVTTCFKAELGNLMFQYAMGRLIAEHKGYKLEISDPDNRRGFLFDNFKNATVVEGKEVRENTMACAHDLQYLDMDAVLGHGGHVFLHGYWQKHYYYFPHRDKIREWFKYDDSAHEKPDADDVVIHVRGKYNEGNRVDLLVPVPVFVQTVKELDYKNCVIVTNDSTPELLKAFEGVKNVVIRSGTVMEDFSFMKHAKRLIMPQSTFSWWAAFLGNPDKVYVPIAVRGDYPCAWKMCPAKEDIDLIPLNDEYVKVRFNE